MKGVVLVVEDEQSTLKSSRMALLEEGYEVRAASTPRDGVSMVREEPFDLVIASLDIAGAGGVDVLRGLRDASPGATLVASTAYPSQKTIIDALRIGVLDFLPKPYSRDLLLEAVEKAIPPVVERTLEDDDYTDEVKAKVDEIVASFKGKPGSLIPVLQAAQEFVGYLPKPVVRQIADGMNMPFSEVHGVITFYSFFSTKPKGKHVVKVCLGTACYVKRAEEIVQKLSEVLGIEMGEVTEDRKFSLESVRCLGACGLAPVVVVDHDTYGSINPVETGNILENYD